MLASAVKKLSQELQLLESSPLEGITIIINEEDISDIQAWIKGPEETPFVNGFFKIRIQLAQDHPASPPKGFFVTKIFHPNVSKNGEICVNTLKKDWTKDLGISQVLISIRCLLILPNAESALNEEAGKLLLEDYDSYFQHAKLWTSIHGLSSPYLGKKLCDSEDNNQILKAIELNSAKLSPVKVDLKEKKRSMRRL